MKACTKCGVKKALDAFYKLATAIDGLRGTCKDCDRARAKTYRQTKRREVNAANRRHTSTVTDGYVRRILAQATGLARGDFTAEMVEIKRQQILLRRRLDAAVMALIAERRAREAA